MNAPAEFCSRGPWSLQELIEKHAWYFTNGASALVELKYLCASVAELGDQPLTGNLQELANRSLHRLRQGFILADIQEHMGALDRLHASVNRPSHLPQLPCSAIALEIKHFISGLFDVLDQEFFFHVDQPDVPLYLEAKPFGERVGRKFPKAAEDIAEASKTLALQRSTACVFHLMRVMEIGIQALGKKLKVAINPETETWYQIGEHVDKAIRALPAQTDREKKRKARLAAASANLNAVRIAWRNEVMHPKQTYTREEAHEVYRATRAFMDHLASLV